MDIDEQAQILSGLRVIPEQSLNSIDVFVTRSWLMLLNEVSEAALQVEVALASLLIDTVHPSQAGKDAAEQRYQMALAVTWNSRSTGQTYTGEGQMRFEHAGSRGGSNH